MRRKQPAAPGLFGLPEVVRQEKAEKASEGEISLPQGQREVLQALPFDQIVETASDVLLKEPFARVCEAHRTAVINLLNAVMSLREQQSRQCLQKEEHIWRTICIYLEGKKQFSQFCLPDRTSAQSSTEWLQKSREALASARSALSQSPTITTPPSVRVFELIFNLVIIFNQEGINVEEQEGWKLMLMCAESESTKCKASLRQFQSAGPQVQQPIPRGRVGHLSAEIGLMAAAGVNRGRGEQRYIERMALARQKALEDKGERPKGFRF